MDLKDFPWCDGGDVGELYLGFAQRFMATAARLGRMKPPHDVSSAMRGVPGVMRELMAADGTMTSGEISVRAGVTDARVANILRALEERGWITRVRAEGDRRRVEVSLTDEGREACRKHTEMIEHSCAGFLRELGEDDARQLLHVMGRIAEVLSQYSENRGE